MAENVDEKNTVEFLIPALEAMGIASCVAILSRFCFHSSMKYSVIRKGSIIITHYQDMKILESISVDISKTKFVLRALS